MGVHRDGLYGVLLTTVLIQEMGPGIRPYRPSEYPVLRPQLLPVDSRFTYRQGRIQVPRVPKGLQRGRFKGCDVGCRGLRVRQFSRQKSVSFEKFEKLGCWELSGGGRCYRTLRTTPRSQYLPEVSKKATFGKTDGFLTCPFWRRKSKYYA